MKHLTISIAAAAVALAACTSASGGMGQTPGAGDGSTRGASASEKALTGQIVFERLYDPADVDGRRATFIASPDGTNEHLLSFQEPFAGGSLGGTPVWAPDGTKLVVGWSPGPGQPWSQVRFRSAIVDPDGSAITLLKPGKLVASLWCFAWSPDGTTLLCTVEDTHPRLEGIYSIHADGTGFTQLTTPNQGVARSDDGCVDGDFLAGYSPDGTRFVFARNRCGTGADPEADKSAALFVANSDGTGVREITEFGTVWPYHGGTVRWSPDGSQILFQGLDGTLTTVQPDGSGLTPIDPDVPCSAGCWAWGSAWSPDGQWIIFTFNDSGDQGNLYRSWPDGTHVTELTDSPKFTEETVDWGMEPTTP